MKNLVFYFCVLFISISFLPTQSSASKLSAYEVLRSYDFPVGLLPQGVTGYELEPKTGKFAAYLNGSCSFSIQGYQLKYKSKITGYISKDKLTQLKGVTVKILFIWVNIIEVTSSGNELGFSVGIISANFPIDNFDESPQCGCGFECHKKKKKKKADRCGIRFNVVNGQDQLIIIEPPYSLDLLCSL